MLTLLIVLFVVLLVFGGIYRPWTPVAPGVGPNYAMSSALAVVLLVLLVWIVFTIVPIHRW